MPVTSLHNALFFALPALIAEDEIGKAEVIRYLEVLGGYAGHYLPMDGDGEPKEVAAANDRLMRRLDRARRAKKKR